MSSNLSKPLIDAVERAVKKQLLTFLSFKTIKSINEKKKKQKLGEGADSNNWNWMKLKIETFKWLLNKINKKVI